ncbi:MAG: glycosyltransferase [Nitrospinae bacterium]|nr:glycosyltransferase [Nitrospinota bacterium]
MFEKNIKVLEATDKELAKRIREHKPKEDFTIEASKEGENTLIYQGNYFHSKYNPVREGEQLFQKATEKIATITPNSHKPFTISGENVGTNELASVIINLNLNAENSTQKKVIFMGCGLGYKLLAAVNSGFSGYWIETEPDILYFAFQSIDLEKVLQNFTIITKLHPYEAFQQIHEKDAKTTFLHHLVPFNNQTKEQEEFCSKFKIKFNYEAINAKHKLKVLTVAPIYGGSLTTYNYMVTALKNIGHNVVEMDCSQFQDSYFKFQKITSKENATNVLRERFVDTISEAIVAKTDDERPNLIIAMAQAPICTTAFERIKKLNIPVAFWFVEDFNTLPYWKTFAPYYDYFFTIQRGEFFACLDMMKANYYYLPQACLPSFHREITVSNKEKKELGSNLSFVGAGYFNRRAFFRKLLDYDFKIWGTEWDTASPVWKKVQRQGERIDSATTLKIFNATKININLHSSTYHKGVNEHGDFVNPRTFEIAASNNFQLVDYRKYLPELFTLGEEIETFSSSDELKEKINYFLANDDKAEKIALASGKRARLEHSFEERLKEMIAVIVASRPETVIDENDAIKERLIKEAGPDTELGKYLQSVDFQGGNFFDSIKEKISHGEGKLSSLEKIMLMVHENIK